MPWYWTDDLARLLIAETAIIVPGEWLSSPVAVWHDSVDPFEVARELEKLQRAVSVA